MICPYCKNLKSQNEVLRNWTMKNGSVKGKRRCPRCKNEFHTVEMVVVIKDRILHEIHNGKHLTAKAIT